MTNRDALRQRIVDAIDEHRAKILEVSETIRVNPEIAFEEHQSSELLASAIREYGYEVEKPIGGLPTAFRASRPGRRDGPKVAVLAEYDALPGLGHGCGHNLIAGSGLAAAIGLSAVMDEVDGTFEVFGTPAEEDGDGKVIMAEAGVFDDVDASLMVHHASDKTFVPTRYPEGRSLAVVPLTIEFFGRTAHASADPFNGANALNALINVFTGIDALRQHVRQETRIHGVITHGGEAPNVVPGYTRGRFMVRSDSREYLEEVLGKVENIAKGAALMTGTEVKIELDAVVLDMRPNYTVGQRYLDNMREVGLEIKPKGSERGVGSTDFGNVSYLMPVANGSFAISHEPIPGHSQQVVDASGSEFGYDQLIKVSKAMALTAFDLLTEPELMARAKDEFANWPPKPES